MYVFGVKLFVIVSTEPRGTRFKQHSVRVYSQCRYDVQIHVVSGQQAPSPGSGGRLLVRMSVCRGMKCPLASHLIVSPSYAVHNDSHGMIKTWTLFSVGIVQCLSCNIPVYTSLKLITYISVKPVPLKICDDFD